MNRILRIILDKWERLDVRNYTTVSFLGGEIKVAKGQCSGADLHVVREWADRAYTDMSEFHPKLPRVSLRMRGEVSPRTGGRTVNGYYKKSCDMIVYKCGVENVIRHELFHVWAWKLGLSYWLTIDHPGGHNLDGTPKA